MFTSNPADPVVVLEYKLEVLRIDAVENGCMYDERTDYYGLADLLKRSL